MWQQQNHRVVQLGLVGFCVVMLAGAGLLHQAAVAEEAEAEPQAQPTLGSLMDTLSAQFRELRRSVRREDQNQQTLTLLANMQQVTLQAKVMQPQLPDGETDQAAMMREYRLKMIELLHALLEAETSLLHGRNTEAMEAVMKMQTIQNEGHERFRIDD